MILYYTRIIELSLYCLWFKMYDFVITLTNKTIDQKLFKTLVSLIIAVVNVVNLTVMFDQSGTEFL